MNSDLYEKEFTDTCSVNSYYIDIAIIGAGIAGLYATYCCGIAGLDCYLLEALEFPGGQCSTIYPEKKVYGTPGFPNIKAKDFINHLSQQALPYANKTFFGYKVEKITKKANLFLIEAHNQCDCQKLHISTKNVILATGIGDMKPSIPPTIQGISELPHDSDFVQHYCMKMDLYKGKKVIIAGGGDSAIDFAINITPIAQEVTLIHRRNQFTCEESKLKDIRKLSSSGKLKIVLENNIVELKEDSKRFVITKGKDSQLHIFETDYIVFCFGFLPNCHSTIFELEKLGLEKENNLIKVDINTMETAIKGCYAAGDNIIYPNKKKNIVPCFFEADRAVRSIKQSYRG